MARYAEVWVSSTGERFYPAEMIASMLGVKPSEIRKPVMAGYLPTGPVQGRRHAPVLA
jgi:hypothetical protein